MYGDRPAFKLRGHGDLRKSLLQLSILTHSLSSLMLANRLGCLVDLE